jgi:hypothetical protein
MLDIGTRTLTKSGKRFSDSISQLKNTEVSALALKYKDLSNRVIEYELNRLAQSTENMLALGPAPLSSIPNSASWGFSDASSMSAQGVDGSAQYTNETVLSQGYRNDGTTELSWGSVNEQNTFLQ